MKLLLTSGGLTNQKIIQGLTDLVKKPFSALNLAFIPTAANVETGDKWWLIEDLEVCKKLGFASIDIVDISALPKELWQKRIAAANVFLFEGGNTFHLMYWVNQSGLKEILPDLLSSRVYVGISAGSIIATPSLILSNSEKSVVKQMKEAVNDDGLAFVDFLIEPHINSIYFPQLTFDYVAKKSKNIPQTIYALDDNSAVKVNGDHVEVISTGRWQKFN